MSDQRFESFGREEAARRTGVSPATITRAITSGALRAKRSGWDEERQVAVGRYLISDQALRDWFDGLPDA